jgi:hypothetical protein
MLQSGLSCLADQLLRRVIDRHRAQDKEWVAGAQGADGLFYGAAGSCPGEIGLSQVVRGRVRWMPPHCLIRCVRVRFLILADCCSGGREYPAWRVQREGDGV